MPDYEPAYIAVGKDGHVTLYWGDGTEAEKHVILRGPRAHDNHELYLVVEDLKAWAESNGYVVIVPAYDLEVPDMEIDLPASDAGHLTMDDVDALLDDLDYAQGDFYDERYNDDFGTDDYPPPYDEAY